MQIITISFSLKVVKYNYLQHTSKQCIMRYMLYINAFSQDAVRGQNRPLIMPLITEYDIEATTGFWGKIWVFFNNFVKYLRYMHVQLNKFVSNI